MTRDADGVPVPVQHRDRLAGRVQRHGAARGPALFLDEIDTRQHVQPTVVAGRVPVDVLVVRPGDHHDLSPDSGSPVGFLVKFLKFCEMLFNSLF